MYCRRCGLFIEGNVDHCPRCGTPTDYSQNGQQTIANPTENNSDDHSSFGFAVFSFLLPLIGIFLFAIMVKSSPKRAKSCLRGAITALLVTMAIFAIFLFIGFLTL